jgi:signal transduction histidine kinase
LKLVPPRIAFAFCLLAAVTFGGALLSSRVFQARHSEAADVTDGWRALAAAEHLAGVLRKAEAICGGSARGHESVAIEETAPRLEVGAAWERLVMEAAARPDRLQFWSAAFDQLQRAIDAPGCSAPFGLTASVVEELSAMQRRDLRQADRRAREGLSAATWVVVATDAALLLLVAAAALAVRGHLQQRERCESEQRRALELQQQLMGIVGHDLRTPLNAIAGSAALLARAPDLPTARVRSAQRIVSSAARMSGLVRDLLDYTRLRVGGGFSLSPEPVHLGEIGRSVAQEVRTAWQGSVIHLTEAGDLRGHWDPERIEQVLSNLIGNACHHGTPGAPVLVRLSGTDEAVRAEVHNQGPPIPSELLPQIFDPFRRGASDRRDASGGVGLGLFIVRSLVEAHGGTIEVTSGQAGTTFTLMLPRSPRDERTALNGRS